MSRGSTPISESVVSPSLARQPTTTEPPVAVRSTTIRDCSPLLVPANAEIVKLTVPPPTLERLGSPFLWGQYNRVLPGVVALRALTRVVEREGKQWIDLKNFHDEAARLATSVGKLLEERDAESSRRRGEKLSTAFPMGSRDIAKAILRYQNQFIGHPQRGEKIYGLLPSALLADVREMSGREVIGLTEAGFHFSSMVWPVLDIAGGLSTHTPEIQAFYARHMAVNLPAEFEAMQTVVNAIKEGQDTPPKLDGVVARFLAKQGTNENLASTVKGGLIGRMTELGFVAPDREGIYVRYTVTEPGDLIIASRTTKHYEEA